MLGQKNDRVFGLDVLRSISILYVVYGHGYHYIDKYINFSGYSIPLLFDGVTSFFVLSGFLIGGIILKLLETDRFKTIGDVCHFWIRRWFRTLPNYYFVLIFLILHTYLNFDHWPAGLNWRYFLFLQNFSSSHPDFFPEAWSLCVEEWFYLLFPVIYLFIAKPIFQNSRMAIISVIVLFLAVPLILRTMYFINGVGVENFDENYRKVMMFRLDSIVYGVLGSFVYYYYPSFWSTNKNKMLYLGLGLLVLNKMFSLLPLFPAFLSFNFETICVLLCLPWLSGYRHCSSSLLTTLFTHISIISYSMYLLNFTPVSRIVMPLIKGLLHIGNESDLINCITVYSLYWFVTISGSYLLYWFFERHMTNLRDTLGK